MMRLRHIVRSALCFLLCLIVCAAPVLAADYSSSLDGFVYPASNAEFLYTSGNINLDILKGYFPASFGAYEEGGPGRVIQGSIVPWEANPCSLALPAETYIEVLFPVDVYSTVTVTPYSNASFGVGNASLAFGHGTSISGFGFKSHKVDFCVDGEYTALTQDGNYWFGIPDNFNVARYWGFRYYFSPGTQTGNLQANYYSLNLKMPDYNKYAFTEDVQRGIYEEVVVNTGILQEIKGTLTDIKTSTATIQNDVSEIKDGLQDSNSGIWNSFKKSLQAMFVPTAGQLGVLKDGFDQLAQDKLGGAYQTVDMVSGGVQSVTDKFKNPGSSPGVEFPGISVPLGGDVGTVTLAASQTVTIPEQMTEVLYPVAGIIIPIVCTIWTVRLGLDMVNCFMSGMSYGEFLHRYTDQEDNEV